MTTSLSGRDTMNRIVSVLIGAVLAVGMGLTTLGCADDIKTTQTITIYEEDPPRMVSPGTEVVE